MDRYCRWARYAPALALLAATAGCSTGSSGHQEIRTAPSRQVTPAAPSGRVVGQYGVELTVPAGWVVAQPICSAPRGPGYVWFESDAIYHCPDLAYGGNPVTQPPSVEFAGNGDRKTLFVPGIPVVNRHGLTVHRSPISCEAGACSSTLAVGTVWLVVSAPRARARALVERVGASLAPIPTDQVAVPFVEPGSSYRHAVRLLEAAGVEVRSRSGQLVGLDFAGTRPGPGTVVGTGTAVTVRGVLD